MRKAFALAVVGAVCLHVVLSAQQVRHSVNVISGTEPLMGDPFLQRQNEAVIAVSTRNGDHLAIAYNDYSTVDMAFDTAPEEGTTGFIAKLRRFFFGPSKTVEPPRAQAPPPEAWIGLSFSQDRGKTFYKMLMPGHPFEPEGSPGRQSPAFGDSAGSDPILVTGQNGRMYLIALTFDRFGISRIISALWQDENNVEGGETQQYRFTRQIDKGSHSSKGLFVDKPAAIAYAGGAATVFSTGGVSKKKKHVVVVPGCERVYTTWTRFEGNDSTGHFRGVVYFAQTASCGDSWSTPLKISGPYTFAGNNYPGTRNQGTSVAVDPDTGHIYVVWRTYEPNGFVWVRSTDGGFTFSPPMSITGASVYPYDQPLILKSQGHPTFRANAYPWMTIYDGRLVVVWQEYANLTPGPTHGKPLSREAGGQARVMLTVGTPNPDGTMSWSERSAADLGDVGLAGENKRSELVFGEADPVERATGAQVMPHVTAREGQVLLTFYESRSTNEYLGGAHPATGYISGIDQQVDVRGTLINPETWQTVNSFQVSRYQVDPSTGHVLENPALAAFPPGSPQHKVRRRVNWANFHIFRGGLGAFIGDYLFTIPLRPDASGPGFWTVSTSNETVDAPPDLDFTKYNAPQQGFLGTCNPGSRNSTIMLAQVATGLVVGSPGTFKQLSTPTGDAIQRAFAVYVENHTAQVRGFRLSFGPVPSGLTVSFEQFSDRPSVDVEVLAGSSITRTVFLTAATDGTGMVPPALATGSVTVHVNEATLNPEHPELIELIPGGLSASLTLNGDATNPFVGGAGGNAGLDATEDHTPDVGSPQQGTPQQGTPQQGTPQQGTPQMGTPQQGTPQQGSPQMSTPQQGSTAPAEDPTITDLTLKVTNEGNTASGYNSLVSFALAQQYAQSGHTFQVILYRVTQSAAPSGCEAAGVAQQDQIIFITPQMGTPQQGTPQQGTPQQGTPQQGSPQQGSPQMGTPQQGSTQLASPSFALEPEDPTPDDHDGTLHSHLGQAAYLIALRIRHPNEAEVGTHPEGEMTGAMSASVEAQAANTGETEPEGDSTDNTPPNTTIVDSPFSPTPNTTTTLTFAGTDNHTPASNLVFMCSLNEAEPTECTSPTTYADLAPGTYSFAVFAVDEAGNADGSPASATFSIIEPTVTITSITPGTAAAGFGQLITVFTSGAPLQTPTAIFRQGAAEVQGFVFESPSKQNEYFARLPFPNDNVADGDPSNGVVPGAAHVRLVFAPEIEGQFQLSQEFPITVSTTPGTPVARFVLALESPPSEDDACGGGLASNEPITDVEPGQGIAISAYGTDTTMAIARFTQGATAIDVESGCTISSNTIGVAAVFTVPPELTGGTATVRLKTSVDEVPSALSNALTLTVETISMTPSASYTVGNEPEGVATGDLNGDGNLDLVTANFNAGATGSISVRFGAGNGTFGAVTNYDMGQGSRDVKLGDLDNDGDLDAVVANLNDGTISVRLGSGTGSFGDLITVAAAGPNNRLALADFDGDGNLDIAVAKGDDDAVGVLFADVEGGFTSQTLYTVGTHAWDVDAADLDGDEDLDLVVSNRGDPPNSGNVSVLLWNGEGFGDATQFDGVPEGTVANLFDLAVGDLDGDGNLDLALGSNVGSVFVVLGNGDGGFGAPTAVSAAAFDRPIALDVADFDSDGNADLAVVNFDSTIVTFLPGDGTGAFGAPVNVNIKSRGNALAVGDFNGDGKPDVAVAQKFSDSVAVVLNTTP